MLFWKACVPGECFCYGHNLTSQESISSLAENRGKVKGGGPFGPLEGRPMAMIY